MTLHCSSHHKKIRLERLIIISHFAYFQERTREERAQIRL